MKDPLTQTFLFHADNILMTNTKKKIKRQKKKKKQGKQSQSISSACLFQVPLRKWEYILYSWRTMRMIIIIFCVFFFFSNTILPTFRYWKIKIPIYSLYKKEAFKSTRKQRTFFCLVWFFFFFFLFYTEKVDKMLGWRRKRRRRRRRRRRRMVIGGQVYRCT